MSAPNSTTTTVGGYGTIETPVILGNASTDLIGMYGATPIDQPAAVTSVTTTAASSTTPYGYTTAAQADAIVASLNALIARARELGSIAT